MLSGYFMPVLEIIVDTVQDAIEAEKGGATHLTVLSHYPSTGVTPSIGMVAQIQRLVSLPLVILVRPHTRNSIPCSQDIETCVSDIKAMNALGIQDFLIEFIDQENNPNQQAIEMIFRCCASIRLHSHFAWQYSRNRAATIEKLIQLGFVSIRTSGKTNSNSWFDNDVTRSIEGICSIRDLVGKRTSVYLTGGITTANVSHLTTSTAIFDLQIGRGVRSPNNSHSPVKSSLVAEIRSKQMKAYKEFIIENNTDKI